MSKIVMLSVELAAPQIVHDLLLKLAAKNPELAAWIEQANTIPLIRECVLKALKNLGAQEGIVLSNSVADYYGKVWHKDYNGMPILGSLKTDKLPNGMGVVLEPDGTIKFVGDNYKSGWRDEIERLQEIFTEAFIDEVGKSILDVLGYQIETREITIETENGQKEQAVIIEGVKHKGVQ